MRTREMRFGVKIPCNCYLHVWMDAFFSIYIYISVCALRIAQRVINFNVFTFD